MTKLHSVTKKLGITGKQLAHITGMSCSSIYKYLSGNRKLSLKVARKIALPLGIEPESIVGDVEEPMLL